MKDTIYTEEEAYKLKRYDQLKLLEIRGVKHNLYIKEEKLVELILKSNPINAPAPKNKVILEFNQEDIILLNQVLGIASAGFPNTDVITFIDTIKEKIN